MSVTLDRKATRIRAATRAKIEEADTAVARDHQKAVNALDLRTRQLQLEEQVEADRARRVAAMTAERHQRAMDRRARRARWLEVTSTLGRRFIQQLAGYTIVVPIVLAIAAAWNGQFLYLTGTRDWSPMWAASAATALECGGLALGRLAWQAHQQGDSRGQHDSARVERLLMWSLVAFSAWCNYQHAHEPIQGGASVLGPVLWETRQRRHYRGWQAAEGALPPRPPRFGATRWLRFPRQTFTARSLAVRERLTDADVALDRAQTEVASQQQRKPSRQIFRERTSTTWRQVVAEQIDATRTTEARQAVATSSHPTNSGKSAGKVWDESGRPEGAG